MPHGVMTIARIELSSSRFLYVTKRSDLPGTRHQGDPEWLGVNAFKIAECFADAPHRIWFGVDVSGLTRQQKIEWVGEMILLGAENVGANNQRRGLKVHIDDPSQIPGQSSS